MMKQERILERKVLQNYVPTLMMKQTRRKKINRNDVNMPSLMMKQERILVRKVLQNYDQQERILVRKVLQNYVPTLMMKQTRRKKINRNKVNVPNLMMKQERSKEGVTKLRSTGKNISKEGATKLRSNLDEEANKKKENK